MHLVAVPEAQRLQKALGKLPGVDRVEVAGALRRTAEVVRDIDLVIESAGAREVSASAAGIPGVTELSVVDEQTLSLQMINGARADVYCAPPNTFDVALWRVTGSREHCEAVIERLRRRGFDMRADALVDSTGRVVDGADEKTIYENAGLAWVPYELRENRGEVEAAAAGELPELIRLGDLRGILHCHSKYSDGNSTIERMAEAANARGWSYIGISDHSQAASYAGGMTPDAVKRQHDEIDELNARLKGFRVLKGIEADILADGGVDFAGDILEQFDYVIGSIHSRFGMAHAQMTDRVLKAMSDPRLTIVGHPTGRLLLRREPFPVDIDAMMEMAAERGIALELNCDPNRLDLGWRLVQVARKRGVTIEIGPDAHSPDELGFVDFGIQIARKGWLEAANVLNTRSADDVVSFAKARRNPSSRKDQRGS
jgi:DNA polymerase (family 10)